MKLNPNGTTAWWRGIGSENGEAIGAIAANDEGLFVGGVFMGEADFNRGGLKPELNTSQGGSRNIFLARFHPGTGEFDWLEQTQGNFSFSWVNALALHSSGIYMSGWFTTNSNSVFAIKFPTEGSDFLKLGCKGENDSFVAKFSYGSHKTQWLKGIGGIGHDYLFGLAVDNEGVYATGYFNASSDLNIAAVLESDPSTQQNPDIKPIAGERDAFLVKYHHSNGALAWSKALASSQDQVGAAVVADASGVYLAGGFEGPLDLNPGGSVPMVKTANSNMDLFLVKFGNTVAGAKEDLTQAKSLHLYPNPTVGALTLESSKEWQGGHYSVKILAMTGGVVWQAPVQLQKNEKILLPTHQLATGHYLLVLQNKTTVVTKKLVKL